MSVCDEEVEHPLDAGFLGLHPFLKPRARLTLLGGLLAVDLFHARVRELLEEVLRLQGVRLPRLFDLAQQPRLVVKLKRPELLELRRGRVAPEPPAGAVVNVVVAGRGSDQRREFPLLLLERVTDVHQVDAVNAQIADDVDLVLADHLRDLARVVLEEVGHQQRPHRLVAARRPALLELQERRLRLFPQGFRGHRRILPCEEFKEFERLAALLRNLRRAVDEVEILVRRPACLTASLADDHDDYEYAQQHHKAKPA